MQKIIPKLQKCEVELTLKIDDIKRKKNNKMMVSSVELVKIKNEILDYGCKVIDQFERS